MSSIMNKIPEPAKKITLYKNGDEYYPGRRFVINNRQFSNMAAFLEYATDALKPSFGAVRNIYTPDGGAKIKSLEEIQSGRSYVAGGNEHFRKIGGARSTRPGLKYQEIGTKKPKPIKKTYSHIKPASHNNRFGEITGRWKQAADEYNQPKQLWLHVNGDSQSSPVRLLLPSRILKLKWEMILDYVTDRVGIRLGHAVRRLYEIEGDLVDGSSDLVTGRTYVACGSERFRRMNYKSGGGVYTAPIVLKRKPLPAIGIKKRRQRSPDREDRSELQNFDNMVDKMMEEKAEKGKKGKKGKKQGTEDIKKKAEEVFEAKPVKVKGKKGKGGKGGAQYVDEDPNMKTEVPVEMQKAKQVKNKKNKLGKSV